MKKTGNPQPYMNPYVAGVFLGVVLFFSYVIFGHGLGASGGLAKITGAVTHLASPQHILDNPYLTGLMYDSSHPLDSWLVYEILGVLIGGLISGFMGGRLGIETFKGPGISTTVRLVAAFSGGAIAGYGVRMARGCTSSQALSGGAVLSAGSWAFMFSVFAGAYLVAYFVRKLWN